MVSWGMSSTPFVSNRWRKHQETSVVPLLCNPAQRISLLDSLSIIAFTLNFCLHSIQFLPRAVDRLLVRRQHAQGAFVHGEILFHPLASGFPHLTAERRVTQDSVKRRGRGLNIIERHENARLAIDYGLRGPARRASHHRAATGHGFEVHISHARLMECG